MKYDMTEDIVISGISGRFPESDNVKEFRDHLMNGIDMVTRDDHRWPVGLYGLPERHGRLKDLTRFDANAFGINQKQANEMDPQIRLLLEGTYEAIADAGVNPVELRGKCVGVFVGTSTTDVFEGLEPEDVSPYCLLGCLKGMFANRISFHFDFQGPSVTVDTGCCSSLTAFDQAIQNIRNGYCDAAIVGGTCVNLSPTVMVGFLGTGTLSRDGICNPFDADAKGYVRSEAVIAVLLQKKSVARREYATVIHSRLNTDGYKEQGITYPSGRRQAELMAKTYDEAGVHPDDVVYVECHGTGTAVGDPEELNSLAEFFCKSRKEPLLIGSLKSNMGHCEGASGLAGVVKLVIAMEEGTIPANLRYKTPNPNIPALVDGRLKVVTENTKWKGGIVGINNFGWGGANAHLILRSNPNTKDTSSQHATGGLKLFNHASRTKENLAKVLDIMESDPNDCEFYTLLSYLAPSPLRTHLYRGYTILNGKEQSSPPEKRPLWYVFPGMGCQWKGMARDMMQVSVFQNTIIRADAILKQFNVSLTNLICNSDDVSWNSTKDMTVVITIIQVAFVNTLRQLGLEPDGFVGHSLGELACAYADGCLTEEQLVLVTYWRNKIMVDHIENNGLMASVGLTLEEVHRRLPENVFCACHNAPHNVTISGCSTNVEAFVMQLQNEGVFAKIVPTGGRASHCPHVAPAGPKIMEIVDELIPNPKLRSTRWISSAFPESEWNTLPAQSFSAEYLVCNMSNPVYFYEALQKIPKNALVMEIGPHALLQAVIKRSLGPEVTTFGIQQRNQSDGYLKFLNSLGKLYVNGVDFDVTKLYEPVPLPVSRGTRMISPLINWDHSDDYNVVPYEYFLKSRKSREVEVSIASEESRDYYLIDHNIDGLVVYPAAGYLILAWNALAEIKGKTHNDMSIVFENVVFHRETHLSTTGTTKLAIGILDAEGRFEISSNGNLVVNGRIYEPQDHSLLYKHVHNTPIQSPQHLQISSKDIYKALTLRGYQYGPSFQKVLETGNDGDCGKLLWDGNWVTFLDAMVQFYVFGSTPRNLYLPTCLDYLRINTVQHPKTDALDTEIPVRFHPIINVISSGGVEIKGIKLSMVNQQPIQQAQPVLEHYLFVPFFEERLANIHSSDILKSCLDIVYENVYSPIIKMVEVRAAKSSWFSQVVPITNSQPTIQADCIMTDVNVSDMNADEVTKDGVRVIKWDVLQEPPQSIAEAHLIFGHDILTVNSQLNSFVQKLAATVTDGGFLLLYQHSLQKEFYDAFEISDLEIIAEKTFDNNSSLFLLRKVKVNESKAYVVIIQDGEYEEWVDLIKLQLSKIAEDDSTEERLWLVAHDSPNNGITGLANCLCLEPGGNKIRTIYNPYLDNGARSLFHNNPVQALKTIYKDIIKKDLFMNVNKGQLWGTYIHLPLDLVQKKTVETTDAYVNVLTQGDLSSLRWIESPMMKSLGNSVTSICQIYYAGLNFQDVLLATGKTSPKALPVDSAYRDGFGMEFSGRDETGHRMMGVVPHSGLATSAVYDRVLKWYIPDTWTMEDAATVPFAYLTVYYAFVVRGGLNRGQSVLIHCGTSDVGQAAIYVALSYDCEIYTTVCSTETKETLLKLFPKLKSTNIFNFTDITFESDIMLATNGKGVDIVLNSLSEVNLLASVRCLAKHGRFLDIGNIDLSNNAFLAKAVFIRNASFHGVFADTLLDNDHPQRQLVSDLLVQGIKDGVVKPLTRHVFNKDEVESALRFMARGKHMGKVLIKVSEEESENLVLKPKKAVIKALSNPVCSSEDAYIITGGLGGFGLELAHWLVDKGAQNLVLSSRTGVRDGYQFNCIRLWRKQGIKVVISLDDITTLEGTTKLLTDASTLGPVKGIFSLAMVLKDGLMANQTPDKFIAVCNPKVKGTQNLDILSRKLCPQLGWFVAFSSLTSGRGNAGQSNYGYANSVMERICEQRRQDGYHGLAIQWGVIGDVGVVWRTMKSKDEAICGSVPQTIRSCISALESFLDQSHPVVSSYVLAEKNNSKGESAKETNLLNRIGHIMGVKDFNVLNPLTTLSEMGMDSIMGIEIKQLLEKHLDKALTMNNISKLNIINLKSMDSNEP